MSALLGKTRRQAGCPGAIRGMYAPRAGSAASPARTQSSSGSRGRISIWPDRFHRWQDSRMRSIPGHVVRPLVRQKVTDQVSTATRNDALPFIGILPEGVELEGVDFVTDEAGDGHAHSVRSVYSGSSSVATIAPCATGM